MTSRSELFVRTILLVAVVASHEEPVETERPAEGLLPTQDGYYLDGLNEASFGTGYVYYGRLYSGDGISAIWAIGGFIAK